MTSASDQGASDLGAAAPVTSAPTVDADTPSDAPAALEAAQAEAPEEVEPAASTSSDPETGSEATGQAEAGQTPVQVGAKVVKGPGQARRAGAPGAPGGAKAGAKGLAGRPAAARASAGKGAPANAGMRRPSGPKAALDDTARAGQNASRGDARARSPDDVNERAARRAAARADQENAEADQPGADTTGTTLPVPRPDDSPPAKQQGRQLAKKGGKGKKNRDKDTPKIDVRPSVAPASMRGRHWMGIFSFLLMVLLPAAVAGWYLWNRAADQYASFVGFSVRTEEVGSSIEILGIATDMSGSSTSDTDILYEFLQSQELVAAVDAELGLRAIWSKADPDVDPIFSYHPPGTIEDLTAYWRRMVKIYYDPGTGLIDLRVLAFDPEDATAVATQVFARSSAMINKLSAIAREDAIKYARDELSQAEDRLRAARVDIQSFRNRTQLIDPTMQTQTQSGLIGALETQLAEAQIEWRLLQENALPTDPRIRQVELKIEVIRTQIAEERAELGVEGIDDNISVADLVGEYEALAVDLEFAQQAYTTALATFVSAQNEARRQTRYLAAHVNPTKAEKSQYPNRVQIMLLLTLLLVLIWAVAILTGYALRDRR